ncbi:MAG TPA: dihydroxyacetone kinase phosphoryl donor subunit DhaM [Streptosporangiaceae bacterium]
MSDNARVGIVLVSHSSALAEGAAEVAAQVGGGAAVIVPAGGTDDGGIGTSAAKIRAALLAAATGAGVLVLPDLGSSVLTVRALLTEPDGLPEPVVLADAPFVEGAVAAAVAAAVGGDIKAVQAAAEEARGVRKL